MKDGGGVPLWVLSNCNILKKKEILIQVEFRVGYAQINCVKPKVCRSFCL